MITLKRLGHVLIRARDKERSRRFYTEVLGFKVSEELPGDAAFLTLGDGFHTFDIAQHPHPDSAAPATADHVGLGHIAFQVDSYDALREAYLTLLDRDVTITRAMDHNSQRSVYFADPDGNGLEIYFEVPNALSIFANGRDDEDRVLPLSKRGEPLPDWLNEEWPALPVPAAG
jgi:catechol 2,3-dioxygenase